MTEVSINKQTKLSQHLASPSVAALGNLSELNCTRLSPHFTLGEMCKTSAKTADGNIPSHVHIENLKRLCGWLEKLRERYNRNYVLDQSPSCALDQTSPCVHDQTPSSSPYLGGESCRRLPLLSRRGQGWSDQAHKARSDELSLYYRLRAPRSIPDYSEVQTYLFFFKQRI